MGNKVLNFKCTDLIYGFKRPFSERSAIDYEYKYSRLDFRDQKAILRSGNFSADKRMDYSNSISFLGTLDTKKGEGRHGVRF